MLHEVTLLHYDVILAVFVALGQDLLSFIIPREESPQ